MAHDKVHFLDISMGRYGRSIDVHVTFENGRRERAGPIYRQLRDAVLNGELRAGELLPPTRELARRLGVARNTVSLAYDRLAAEGLVEGRTGSGTYVSTNVLPSHTVRQPAGALRPRPVWDRIPDQPILSAVDPDFDLRAGLPDPHSFPYDTWRRLVAHEHRSGAGPSSGYDDPGGHPGLRAAIARHVALSRGVTTSAADVVVTAGAQQAIDLIVRVLVAPGEAVAIEDPGYPQVAHLLTTYGARVVPVPVDGEGLVVDALPIDVRLVYVTPSHQFPLGTAMSLPRRLGLLDWARRHGAAIIEDDYDSEFRYAGQPLETLHSLDRASRVLYVGSFSKSLSPSLRLGFAVTTPELRRVLTLARMFADWHSPLAPQAALARFIDDGHLARHVRRMRARYEARHAAVRAALAEDCRDVLDVVPSATGLHLSARTRPSDDLLAVLARAEAAGVATNPISQFTLGTADPGIVIGYGAIPTARIPEAMHRLRAAFGSRRTAGLSRATPGR